MDSLERRFFAAKKKCFDKLYSRLNPRQREAVFCVRGPLLVLAGAGSGKTTVLVHRIAHIIRYGDAYESARVPDALSEDEVAYLESMAENGDVDPDSLLRYADGAVPPYAVLAITFTNKAAGSMKSKLERLLSESANEVWAGTFHSVCARILRTEIKRLGYDRDFAIYDTDDTKKLITECEKQLDISTDKFPPRQIQNLISKTKEALTDSADFAEKAGSDYFLSTVAKVFSLYEEKLRAANALDFDDLIGKTVKIFTEFPDALEHWQRRFRYILVDEYQDTNRSQFMLVSMLSALSGNIMVVGDDDQSIYSFRGATVDNILTFDKSFAGAKIIKLEQNYRSTASILGAANSLIAKNRGRYGKTLWCDGDAGTLPSIVRVDDQSAEVSFIADTIADKVAEGAKFSDFAILYRMNAQSAGFETVFAKSGIPYRMLCGIRFYERAEVKDVVSYMQLIANGRDDTRLRRIINVPRRGIGETTLDAVAAIAAHEGAPMLDVIRRAKDYEALSRAAEKLSEFARFIDGMRALSETVAPDELAKTLITRSGYEDMLFAKGEEGAEKLENLKELVNNIAIHVENNPEATLTSFLEEVSLIADVDNYDENANAVTMMTVHSAKGLEFPFVFVPGMEEGIFPSSLCVSETEIEEERRLAYVAFTRAEKGLWVTYAGERMLYGRTNSNQPSRFLRDVAPEYKNEISLASRPRYYGGYFAKEAPSYGQSKEYFAPAAPKRQARPVAMPEKRAAPEKIFAVGTSVVHKTFGEGVVLSVTNMGGDTLYEVAFEKVGTKKLMAAYAKLAEKK